MGENNRIPQHLEPLLDGTPLALERIRQAWSSLAMSDRAYLVSALLGNGRKGPRTLKFEYHRNVVIDLAFADKSSYIRYLVAKHVPTPDERADVSVVGRFDKVRTDPVMLVRFAREEQEDHGLFSIGRKPDFARFWQQPQIARLALVNDEKVEYIAGLLRFATKELLPVGLVGLCEMADVLLQFIGPRFAVDFAGSVEHASFSYDGSFMHGLGQDAKSLWKLIPDMPKELAYILLDRLPEPTYSAFPTDVIESLDAHQLSCLLWRSDIKAEELRRRTFTESTNESVRNGAVSSPAFRLLDSDISQLVFSLSESEESGRKKLKELVMLARYCRGATLVQMMAIFDLIFNAPNAFTGIDSSMELDSARQLQTERARRLSATVLEHEVLEMRLFALAKRLSPLKADEEPYSLPEKLKKHGLLVIPGDPWETFLNLRRTISLEWIRDIGELPRVSIQSFDLADEPVQNTNQVFDLLNELQSKVMEVSEQERAELSVLNSALTKISTRVLDAEVSTSQRFIGLQKKLNILLWILAALSLLLIFRFR